MDDIKKLMHIIENVDNLMHKCIFTIALYSGLREGEILSLTIKDIDSKNNCIDVSKQ